jgi:ubiquinone/menaquinone biosynthesis C-methylase UbiE
VSASDLEMSDRIKEYWDERARATDVSSVQATTYDAYLREHEIRTLRDRLAAASLPEGATVVDLGCGDGHSTLSLAAEFPTLRFLGVDWSEEMLTLARQRLAERPQLGDRVSFRAGDMRDLTPSLGSERFEAFMTMRSLINLTTSEQQYATIAQIGDHLVPGGYYFCVENFLGGQESFNRMREAVGLPEIPVRWHNVFFDEARFVDEVGTKFDSITFSNFLSSYYLATRVIYSAGCYLAGEEPDYFHPIHQIAARLPEIGDYCPIKLVSMRRKL